MGETTPAVAAVGIRKSFELDHELPVRALRGADLTVGAGEFVAVTGPSGCGKSTLLHVLAGLECPEDGQVHIDGHDLLAMTSDERAHFRRTGMGLVFQEVHLLEGLTVAANVALPAIVAGVDREAADLRARETLSLVGIGDRATRSVNGLSGGERQRVALARALANHPPVLLADEPTGSLDSAGRDEILELLTRLHDRGQAIVLVTHDPTAAAVADRIVAMIDGRTESPHSGVSTVPGDRP
jgi:putative ABC transport system ATP-binding protein